MSDTNAVEKAIALLHDQEKRIQNLEALKEPSGSDSKMLSAFRRVAAACAAQKGFAIAGSDSTSEIVRRLAFPIAVKSLRNAAADAAVQKIRREADASSMKKLSKLSKSAATNPSDFKDLASELLSICARRGIAVSPTAGVAELWNQVGPLIQINSLQQKTTLR